MRHKGCKTATFYQSDGFDQRFVPFTEWHLEKYHVRPLNRKALQPLHLLKPAANEHLCPQNNFGHTGVNNSHKCFCATLAQIKELSDCNIRRVKMRRGYDTIYPRSVQKLKLSFGGLDRIRSVVGARKHMGMKIGDPYTVSHIFLLKYVQKLSGSAPVGTVILCVPSFVVPVCL